MVDVVGGGYMLGEPLGLAINRARPEKFRVVVEPADSAASSLRLLAARSSSPNHDINQSQLPPL